MSCNCPKCAYVAPHKRSIDISNLKPGAMLNAITTICSVQSATVRLECHCKN